MPVGNLLNRVKGLVLALALGLTTSAESLGRFLDPPRPAGDGVRLVVFNPTVHNIRGLAALKEKGILSVANLTVVGVFHARQKEDFALSRKYLLEQGITWFQFHEVAADISESAIFIRNACTPEFEAIIQKADGVIFFGGPDIPASIFGQKNNLLTEIEDPVRHYLELSAICHFLGSSKAPSHKAILEVRPAFPVLGICLGLQSLNVGTGGTLIQDIPTGLYRKASFEAVLTQDPDQWHNNPYRRLFPMDKLMGYNFHTLQLNGKGQITKAMGFGPGDHPRVLSSHHQSIGRLGQGWVSTATSRDGKVIEAIEHSRFPNVLGVQFHPEHPQLWDTELRVRQRPGEPLTSYHAILAGTPRSIEFNQAIWQWFGQRLQESRSH